MQLSRYELAFKYVLHNRTDSANLCEQHTPSLNTAQAFTAYAIIGLLSGPASVFLASIPSVAGSLGAFKRLQEYLLSEQRQDSRQILVKPIRGVHKDSALNNTAGVLDDSIELVTLRPEGVQMILTPAITMQDLTVQYPHATAPALGDITTSIGAGSLTMILGPVGSGKTTMLRIILGEMTSDSGTICVSSPEISFCGQSPWLTNRSIQQIICGPGVTGAVDEVWYNTVVHACVLDRDFAALPEGDLTVIGSKGLTLSGGQRQRLVCYYTTSLHRY